jgi:hypothetical protein
MKRLLITILGILLLVSIVSAAQTCYFDDPVSASLNLERISN